MRLELFADINVVIQSHEAMFGSCELSLSKEKDGDEHETIRSNVTSSTTVRSRLLQQNLCKHVDALKK